MIRRVRLGLVTANLADRARLWPNVDCHCKADRNVFLPSMTSDEPLLRETQSPTRLTEDKDIVLRMRSQDIGPFRKQFRKEYPNALEPYHHDPHVQEDGRSLTPVQ